MEKKDTFHLSKSMLIVMGTIIISRMTGFVKEALVPNMLDMQYVGDAYNIAILIPELLYNLLVGGAIASGLIPVLTAYVKKDREKEGWQSVSIFMNVALLLLIVLCAIGMIFTRQFIGIFTVAFREDQNAQLDLTVQLTRIMLPSIVFLMLSGICNGVLNTYHKFAISTLGPAFYNVFCAISLFFLSRYGVTTVAYGVLVSSALYFLCQLFFSRKHFRLYSIFVDLKNTGFRKLCRLTVPSLFASSIVQLNIIIATQFVTMFGAGSVTSFRMADRIWQMPYGIVAQGIGITILPSLSAFAAEHKMEQYRDLLVKGLRYVLLFCVPIAAVLAISGRTIIDVAFKMTSKVTGDSVLLVSQILLFFALAVIFQSMVTVLNRAFYAVNNTKTPFYTGLISIFFNVGFIFLFREKLQIGGVALAYSLASFINCFLLFTRLNKSVARLQVKQFLQYMLKILLGACLCALVLYMQTRYISTDTYGKMIKMVFLLLEVGIAGIVYVALLALFRVREVTDVCRNIKNKILVKRKRVL